jgi:conserved domain protein
MAETNALQEILVTLGDKPLNVNVNIPGIKGDNGQDGHNGADGLSAYDIAQLNGFKGTQQEWLESLKAGAVADEARTMLLNGNVWCKSAAISDVLAAVISNLGKAFPRTEFKQLKVPNVLQGQRIIAVEGEPHYFVKVAGMETPFEIDDNGTGSISIEPLGVDDIPLTYHNFIGEKVGETVIAGIHDNTRTPDDTYTENGVKYELFGRKLEINVTNFTGYNAIKMLGKWLASEIDSILIKTSRNVKPVTGNGSFTDKSGNAIGNIPIIVETPQKVTFNNTDNNSTPIKIGTLQYGVYDVRFQSSRIEWYDSMHRYVSAGAAVDHL